MEITTDIQMTKEAGAKRPASEYVTLVEVLELTRPFEEFAAATGDPPVLVCGNAYQRRCVTRRHDAQRRARDRATGRNPLHRW